MSVKQDRQGVRTAQDLERKYDLKSLGGMRKAVKINEDTLNKINKILEDFISETLGAIGDLKAQVDGKVVTWYYSGVPTLENEPAKNWTTDELKTEHTGDLYYDKDTGYVYRYEFDGEKGSWQRIVDKDLATALAIANASKDTADSKRRIFTEQPKPPYDNGDLWFKDKEIYICQISKPEGEAYEEKDFIVATKYTDDTVANEVGGKLEVLEGTVLTIIEDAEFLKIELEDLDKNTSSEIELLKNMLSTLITDENNQSMMVQTPTGWQFNMSSIIESLSNNSEKVDELESELNGTSNDLENIKDAVSSIENKITYVNIGTRDGKPCIELGASDSKFKVIITNEEILFAEGSAIPAYISNETLYINKAKVEEELQIATLAFVKRANGHITLMPKGVM